MNNGSQTTFEFNTCGSLALEPVENGFMVLDGNGGKSIEAMNGSGILENADRKTAQRRISWRTILALVVVSVGFTIATTLIGNSMRTRSVDASFDNANVTTVVTESGTTVWGYASKCNVRGASTNEIVQWIERKNGISGGKLGTGERIQLPNFEG